MLGVKCFVGTSSDVVVAVFELQPSMMEDVSTAEVPPPLTF